MSDTRPTIDEIECKYNMDVRGRTFFCPKQRNKGKAGLMLEGLLGIPTSSACLDCEDGELKAFPQSKATSRSRLARQFGLEVGEYLASETVAITMMKPCELPSTTFEASRLCKKISNVLFTPYVRNGDNIIWNESVRFNREHPIFEEIKKDYERIQEYYSKHGVTKGKIGKYLQVRTKGAGRGAPKTHAFYFRRQFLIKIYE